MKSIAKILILIVGAFFIKISLAAPSPQNLNISKPLYTPFIEKYILDELKQLRIEQQDIRIELAEKVSDAKLDVSDRAIRYASDTMTNIFYIITVVASLLVLLGWRSFTDMKESVEEITSQKISSLTLEYETRLKKIEDKARVRSEQIINTQQEIVNTNQIHSLWMRLGITKSDQEKIKIFNEILEINPDNIEALTYKADTLLDIDEDKWSLSLSSRAIEINHEYGLAHWQRACAKAKLGMHDDAVADIKAAIELTESLKLEITEETYFESLRGNSKFNELLADIGVSYDKS